VDAPGGCGDPESADATDISDPSPARSPGDHVNSRPPGALNNKDSSRAQAAAA